MADLIYKNLSYELNGIVFATDNKMGYGYREKLYADAFEKLLQSRKIGYKRELVHDVIIDNQLIAKRSFDFLVDDKIIVEIKTGDYRYRESYHQILEYLKTSGFKLGLIVRFAPNGVRIKRILNY